jgi:hypothetical protein
VYSINDKLKRTFPQFISLYDSGISTFCGTLEVDSLCRSDVLTMVNYLRCLSNSLLDHALPEFNGRVKITNLSRVSMSTVKYTMCDSESQSQSLVE